MEEASLGDDVVSKPVAVAACTAMAFFYVAVLYFPTLILRLPPPSCYNAFLIRRFICAAISSIVSVIVCSLILPIKNWDISLLIGVFGIRVDHTWQALAFPLFLTSLLYAGSLARKSLKLLSSWRESQDCSIDVAHLPQTFFGWIILYSSNVLAWRNYVVAPLTEELVFRACMIPLLVCGGFRMYAIIFFSPIYFSLAHLNHLYELYTQQDYSLKKAFMVVGLQLGYTVVFGSYASFLFIRTGHLVAPVVAHIFCNFMGLPILFSRKNGIIVTMVFVAGLVGFVWLLFPLTSPGLYNERTDDCRCWHGYCVWN